MKRLGGTSVRTFLAFALVGGIVATAGVAIAQDSDETTPPEDSPAAVEEAKQEFLHEEGIPAERLVEPCRETLEKGPSSICEEVIKAYEDTSTQPEGSN